MELSPLSPSLPQPPPPNAEAMRTQEAFQQFVGETFFGLMMKALRSTEGETAYLNGGQAEQMFRGQMDQEVASRLAASHGETISGPLYGAFRRGLDVSV